MSTPEAEARNLVRSLWWVSSLIGILTLGVGVFLVIAPHETLSTITVIVGILLVVDGLLAVLGSIFGERESRGVLALVGVLTVVAGLVLIKHPFETLVILTVIVGIWFVVAGIARFVASFSLEGGRTFSFFMAILDMVAGTVILSWPELGLATLAIIIGIVLIVRGFLLALLGWQLSRIPAEPSGATV